MTSIEPWSEAATPTDRRGSRRRPELVALPADRLPSVDELFSFARDAELRFDTLRMRIEEVAATTRGDHLVSTELLLRHPGEARVTTTEPEGGTRGNYELWLSDGATVRTYVATHKLGTKRPVRMAVRGLDDPDLPGASKVYVPLTDLPMETLPETFVHPAGYCQNVLATGRCRVTGTDTIGDRQAIVVISDHPRTIELAADRPDIAIERAFDRADGTVLRRIERIGGRGTSEATVVDYGPDAPLAPSAFNFTFPSDTRMLF
jgi:outer membrane lipoprotein-sorting protein